MSDRPNTVQGAQAAISIPRSYRDIKSRLLILGASIIAGLALSIGVRSLARRRSCARGK